MKTVFPQPKSQLKTSSHNMFGLVWSTFLAARPVWPLPIACRARFNVVLLSKKHGVAANLRLAVISRLGRQHVHDGLNCLAIDDIGQQRLSHCKITNLAGWQAAVVPFGQTWMATPAFFICCCTAFAGKRALLVIEVSTLLDVFALAHLGLFLALFSFFSPVFSCFRPCLFSS